MSLNRVMLIGNVTKEIELKHTPSGASVANFGLAMNEKYTDKQGQKQEKTEFVNIVAWGKTAELCSQYLNKGSQCYIEGSMQTRSYDDKDGNKKYVTEVVARSVQFLGGKSNNDNQKPVEQKEYDVKTDANFAAESIPF